MKKPHVLNRRMFNVKGNSAYGKGIASNLVTEKQRIQYNSGGRVRLAEGSGYQFSQTPIGKAGKTFLHRGLYDPLVAGFDMFGAVPLNTAARMFGYNPGFSGTKLMDIGTGGEYSKYGNLDPDIAYFPPFMKTSAKEGWAHQPRVEEDPEGEETTDSWKEEIEKIKSIKQNSSEIVDKEKEIETDKIDLTPSEKAGLFSSMVMSGGAGAMDKKNKNVQDVLRGFLTGAAGAGVKAVDPTVERLWRKRGEASKDTQMAILDKQAQLATSPAAVRAARQKELGVGPAAEVEAFDMVLPTVGSQPKHKQLNKLLAQSEGKGPKAGPVVKDEDTGEVLIWNGQTKKYERFSFAEGIEIWNKMRP